MKPIRRDSPVNVKTVRKPIKVNSTIRKTIVRSPTVQDFSVYLKPVINEKK